MGTGLDRAPFITVSMTDEDGMPYAVPLSLARTDEKTWYFHCAMDGKKMDIELLLDYCLRFYERQFITREPINHDVLTRFESLLNNYFLSEKAQQNGLPTVKYFATELCLSPNYFGDLIKKETSRSVKECIQSKIMDIAKENLLNSEKSIGQIAYEIGFQYPQHFTRLFKKVVGQTPNNKIGS